MIASVHHVDVKEKSSNYGESAPRTTGPSPPEQGFTLWQDGAAKCYHAYLTALIDEHGDDACVEYGLAFLQLSLEIYGSEFVRGCDGSNGGSTDACPFRGTIHRTLAASCFFDGNAGLEICLSHKYVDGVIEIVQQAGLRSGIRGSGVTIPVDHGAVIQSLEASLGYALGGLVQALKSVTIESDGTCNGRCINNYSNCRTSAHVGQVCRLVRLLWVSLWKQEIGVDREMSWQDSRDVCGVFRTIEDRVSTVIEQCVALVLTDELVTDVAFMKRFSTAIGLAVVEAFKEFPVHATVKGARDALSLRVLSKCTVVATHLPLTFYQATQ